MRGGKRRCGWLLRADCRVWFLHLRVLLTACRRCWDLWIGLYAWNLGTRGRTGYALTHGTVTSRAGRIGRRRLASAVHFGDVLAGAPPCREQVADGCHRFERLDDRDLRPDLRGGDHLEPCRQGGGHGLRGRRTEPAHAAIGRISDLAGAFARRGRWGVQAGPGRGRPSRTSSVREVMPSLVKTFRRW